MLYLTSNVVKLIYLSKLPLTSSQPLTRWYYANLSCCLFSIKSNLIKSFNFYNINFKKDAFYAHPESGRIMRPFSAILSYGLRNGGYRKYREEPAGNPAKRPFPGGHGDKVDRRGNRQQETAVQPAAIPQTGERNSGRKIRQQYPHAEAMEVFC